MRLRRVWRYPAVRVMLLAVAAAAVTALVITFVQERERIDVEAKSRLARKELAPHGETVEQTEIECCLPWRRRGEEKVFKKGTAFLAIERSDGEDRVACHQ